MVANDSSLVRRKTIAMRFGENSNQLESRTSLYLIKRNTFWTFVGGDDTRSRLDSFVLSGEYSISEPHDAKPAK
jgi:hypothetical protein